MLPDNRIRLTPPAIDFTNEVGETGKAHDTFPDAGQARYDHLRSYLMGLLSNQGSFTSPTEFRIGSLWFDLNTGTFKFRNNEGAIIDHAGTSWDSIAKGIGLDTNLTLDDWYTQVKEIISDTPSETSKFNRIPLFTSSEQIDGGKFVYVSGNGTVGVADRDIASKDLTVGVAMATVDSSNEIGVKNSGMMTVRMEQGLSLAANDIVMLSANGLGTNLGSSQKVGIVVDASVYDAAEDNPVATILIMLSY